MKVIKEDEVTSDEEPVTKEECLDDYDPQDPRNSLSRTSSIRLGPHDGIRQSNEKHLDQATGVVRNHQENIHEIEQEDNNKNGPTRSTTSPGKRYRVESSAPPAMSSLRFYFFGPMNYTNYIANYMRWSYRASFINVAFTILLAFFAIIFFFAVLIYWVGYSQSHCVVANKLGKHTFVDAYHLSWTTLSTVGYGVTFPQNANARGKNNLCVGINMVMAFEAFLGVLFAGVTGAIIYGKITRIQMIAQVSFSYPICVRYGEGVSTMQEDSDDGMKPDKEFPFPVLEFRIMNDLCHYGGGEIVDASVKVVATTPVTEKDGSGQILYAKDVLQGGANRRKSGIMETGKNVGQTLGTASKMATKGIGTAGKIATKGIGSATKASINITKGVGAAGLNLTKGVGVMSKTAASNVGTAMSLVQRHLLRTKASAQTGSDVDSTTPEGSEISETDSSSVMDEKELEMVLEQAFEQRFVEKLERERAKLAPLRHNLLQEQSYVVADENDSELCPARRVDTLKIETESHPFFKRTWLIRHELDAASPLWTPEARRFMASNGGGRSFPAELNHHAAIRKHLFFQELLVSFSGTSNCSGQTVFAHKMYEIDVVNIGYTFAPVLHMCSKTSEILVDQALFNDVREQVGGGGEPFAKVERDDDGLVGAAVATVEGVAAAGARVVGETSSMGTKAAKGVVNVTAKTLEGATAAANAAAKAAGSGAPVISTGSSRSKV